MLQRRNRELASLLEQHSSMNSTLMAQLDDLVSFYVFSSLEFSSSSSGCGSGSHACCMYYVYDSYNN